MEKMDIRFYKPSQKFLNVKEHVVVGTENDVLAILGPYEMIETQAQLENWIDTSAQAVIFLFSFEIFGLFFHGDNTEEKKEELKVKIKVAIADYLERSNGSIHKNDKIRFCNMIEDRLYEIIR